MDQSLKGQEIYACGTVPKKERNDRSIFRDFSSNPALSGQEWESTAVTLICPWTISLPLVIIEKCPWSNSLVLIQQRSCSHFLWCERCCWKELTFSFLDLDLADTQKEKRQRPGLTRAYVTSDLEWRTWCCSSFLFLLTPGSSTSGSHLSTSP